jgi:hypothetical protein
MQELTAPYSSGVMNAAAPDGTPPRRIGDYQKNSFPAVPLRGPEVGFLHVDENFYGAGINQIDSCLFLQSQKKEGFKKKPLPGNL